MDLLVLTQHIEELVASTDTLKDQFGDEWLFVGVAGSFPAITIDGISCVDDKQGKYLFNLNLILRSADDSFSDQEAFYQFADELKEALHTSNMVAGGSWVPRHEPGNLRALYACQVWL